MSENTTIIVSKETRKTLKSIGSKGESYDALIRRLIKTEAVAKLELGVPLLQKFLDIEEEVKPEEAVD